MKPVKKKLHQTVNFFQAVKRLMNVEGFRTEQELARFWGLEPNDLSNRKKSGSILPFLVSWALHKNVNVNWLLTGKVEEGDIEYVVHEKQGGYISTSTELKRFKSEVKKILSSLEDRITSLEAYTARDNSGHPVKTAEDHLKR